jgi:hypothetical protein
VEQNQFINQMQQRQEEHQVVDREALQMIQATEMVEQQVAHLLSHLLSLEQLEEDLAAAVLVAVEILELAEVETLVEAQVVMAVAEEEIMVLGQAEVTEPQV